MNPHDTEKKQDVNFRWCEFREQYIALSVCEKLAREKLRCKKCISGYEQLALPFSFPKK